MLYTLLNGDHPIPPSSTLTPGTRYIGASDAFDAGMNRNGNRIVDGETSLMAHPRKARLVIAPTTVDPVNVQ